MVVVLHLLLCREPVVKEFSVIDGNELIADLSVDSVHGVW